ncbi:MAG: tRNA-dihydrouridine synthase family protein [Gammaproteobacteria bacterium]
MLFAPLKLKHRTLPSNVIQGPLAGYSCAAMRRLYWPFGGLGYATTEMISAHDLVHRLTHPQRYLHKDPLEQYTAYQLSANDPCVLAQATTLVTQAGADIVDLNCGCPVKKIRRKHSGSKLLEQPALLDTLIRAMQDHTSALVSIKIRVPTPLNDFCIDEVLEVAERRQIDLLIVHGRHWTQRYDVACQTDAIRAIVKRTHIPVIANGDVADYASLVALSQATGCRGIMIARAGVGQPWLFEQLRQQHLGKSFTLPSIEQQGQLLQEHLRYLATMESDKTTTLQARKLAKYYARYLPQRQAFVLAAQSCDNLNELYNLIEKYFQSGIVPDNCAAMRII